MAVGENAWPVARGRRGVVGRQIEDVAVMWHRRPVHRNRSGTAELENAGGRIPWSWAGALIRSGISSECSPRSLTISTKSTKCFTVNFVDYTSTVQYAIQIKNAHYCLGATILSVPIFFTTHVHLTPFLLFPTPLLPSFLIFFPSSLPLFSTSSIFCIFCYETFPLTFCPKFNSVRVW